MFLNWIQRLREWWCQHDGHSYTPWGYSQGRVVALECTVCGKMNVLRPAEYLEMKQMEEGKI